MRQRWIAGYLLALVLYVLAGTPLAPFHGDESTLIYGSRDYFDQFVNGDLARVMNRRSDDADDHALRLLEGRVQKYLGGFVFHMTGGSIEQLNRPWQWGMPPQIAIRERYAPTMRLLMAERWPMAVLLALSIPAAAVLGRQLGGDAGGVLLATLIATSPNLVLNGRRAMMEAPLLLFSLLAIVAAIQLATSLDTAGKWPFLWRRIAVFGLSAGMAMASKHSALLIAGPLFVAMSAWLLMRQVGRGVVQLGVAAVITVAVFLALNPAWWTSPFAAAADTMRLRADLMKMQVSAFGGYPNFSAAATGFVRYAIIETPQYFEVPFWQELGPSIAAYRFSPWVLPPSLNLLRAIVTTVLAAIGIVMLARRRDAVAAIAATWIAVAIVLTIVITPVPWARYYLPALPAIYALAAVGIGGVRSVRLREPG